MWKKAMFTKKKTEKGEEKKPKLFIIAHPRSKTASRAAKTENRKKKLFNSNEMIIYGPLSTCYSLSRTFARFGVWVFVLTVCSGYGWQMAMMFWISHTHTNTSKCKTKEIKSSLSLTMSLIFLIYSCVSFLFSPFT